VRFHGSSSESSSFTDRRSFAADLVAYSSIAYLLEGLEPELREVRSPFSLLSSHPPAILPALCFREYLADLPASTQLFGTVEDSPFVSESMASRVF
jgi:hypothetical protein